MLLSSDRPRWHHYSHPDVHLNTGDRWRSARTLTCVVLAALCLLLGVVGLSTVDRAPSYADARGPRHAARHRSTHNADGVAPPSAAALHWDPAYYPPLTEYDCGRGAREPDWSDPACSEPENWVQDRPPLAFRPGPYVCTEFNVVHHDGGTYLFHTASMEFGCVASLDHDSWLGISIDSVVCRLADPNRLSPLDVCFPELSLDCPCKRVGQVLDYERGYWVPVD